jgi:dTDP-glucose pyrophosphorylase
MKTIKEITGATQSAMHGWDFEDLVDGGIEETRVVEESDNHAKIQCDLADGQRFYVTVTLT